PFPRRSLLGWKRMHSSAGPSADTSTNAHRINRCFPSFSRRAVDDLVSSGRIAVNGETAVLGEKIHPGDKLTLDGNIVNWESHTAKTKDEFLYIKCWKPPGVVCTANLSDPNNIFSFFNFEKLPDRVFTIGRLDKASSGLLLLTSDGNLMNKLLGGHNRKVEKRYVVTATDKISRSSIEFMRTGVRIELPKKSTGKSKHVKDEFYEYTTLPCTVKRLANSNRIVEITLVEGKNKQIRRMFQSLDLSVEHLHRVSFGGIQLDPLEGGEWGHLSPHEVKKLRNIGSSP
ncbi:unnamed protein product, partial [Ectocarpus fasciculatus]